MKKIILYLRGHNLYPYIILMIMVITNFLYHSKTNKILNDIKNSYNERQFNAFSVPNGLVIYKSGVASTFNPKINEDSVWKYDLFEVGIWDTRRDIIYKLIVPRYVHNRFMVGYYVHGEPTDSGISTDSTKKSKERPVQSDLFSTWNSTKVNH